MEDFIKAGNVAAKARDYGASLVKEGVFIRDILDKVEEFIIDKGAGIAFPAQISMNNIAAHQCSDDDDKTVIASGDVVKLDVGAHVNGYIGDTARTINLSKEFDDLVKASRNALDAALKLAKPGNAVGLLGEAIQGEITDMGFYPVRNLSGHGLGRFEIHTKPSIPNVKQDNSPELVDGQTIAIEPFATNGKGAITEGGRPTVFTIGQLRPVRSPFARAVLQEIKSYNGLPFTTRWLTRKLGVGKTKFGLRELMQHGVIDAHPPLPEIGGGLVSQAEHSVLVKDSPVITTKL